MEQLYQIRESLDAMNDLLSLMDVYVSIEYEELGIKAGEESKAPRELVDLVTAIEVSRKDLREIGQIANDTLKVCPTSTNIL